MVPTLRKSDGMNVSVQTADFDVGTEIAALTVDDPEAGAVASFVGLVRADKLSAQAVGSNVTAMTLEHYPGMTEQALADIVTTARSRWELRAVRVIHRIGRLLPGERIVFVGVSSSHRGDAFAACEFIMDYLKTQAPFWKKEESPEGPAGEPRGRWVDARETDNLAVRRWQDSEAG
jgi:molybdopterin synthase catalytic subunit